MVIDNNPKNNFSFNFMLFLVLVLDSSITLMLLVGGTKQSMADVL